MSDPFWDAVGKDAREVISTLQRERNEARAEVERLREAASAVLGDYEPPDSSHGLDAFMEAVTKVAGELTARTLNDLYAALNGKESP